MNQTTNNNKPTTESFRKQHTQFIVTNSFVGTKSLSEILTNLAMSEINKAITDNEKIFKNAI